MKEIHTISIISNWKGNVILKYCCGEYRALPLLEKITGFWNKRKTLEKEKKINSIKTKELGEKKAPRNRTLNTFQKICIKWPPNVEINQTNSNSGVDADSCQLRIWPRTSQLSDKITVTLEKNRLVLLNSTRNPSQGVIKNRIWKTWDVKGAEQWLGTRAFLLFQHKSADVPRSPESKAAPFVQPPHSKTAASAWLKAGQG